MERPLFFFPQFFSIMTSFNFIHIRDLIMFQSVTNTINEVNHLSLYILKTKFWKFRYLLNIQVMFWTCLIFTYSTTNFILINMCKGLFETLYVGNIKSDFMYYSHSRRFSLFAIALFIFPYHTECFVVYWEINIRNLLREYKWNRKSSPFFFYLITTSQIIYF